MFAFGDTATRTVRLNDEFDTVIGTEQVEIIGITSKNGQVIVRPFHGDDHILVMMRDLGPAD